MIRLITPAESQLFVDRFIAETTRAGDQRPKTLTAGAVEQALAAGALYLVNDLEPSWCVVCHHEPAEPLTDIYVNELWGKSERVLDLGLQTTLFLTGRGYIRAKWAPDGVYAAQFAALTGAIIDPITGVALVPLAQAANRIILAGGKSADV